MGAIEKRAKTRKRKRDLRTAALIVVGAVGLVGVAAVAPKLVQLLETTGVNARLRYKTMRALSRLKHKGEVEFVQRGGKKYVRLTPAGKRALAVQKEKATLSAANKKRRKWDGRYRLVMFDIPEKRKRQRDLLRKEMRAIGFLRVQHSSWVYPYDCEEFIALLKTDLGLGKGVLYAVVDELENDEWIRKHFGFPPR